MDSAAFVKHSGELLATYGWGSLKAPVASVAEAIFPQIAALDRRRICPAIHPIRVIEHVLIAVAEMPQPEDIVLALVIAALCHDTADIPKVTKTGVAPNDIGHERRRILFRLRHEATGAVHLVQAIERSDETLTSAGQSPISLDVVQVAYQIAVQHDGPSRDQRLPLDPSSPASQALELFVRADTVTMVEYLPPLLRGAAPVGPMTGIWAAGKEFSAERIGAQLVSSAASVCRRMRAAFGLPGDPGIERCFPIAALGGRAVRYMAEWGAELG